MAVATVGGRGMMLLLPLVTVALLVAALMTGRWVAVTALVAIGLIYAATLVAISLDPYFEDNGSREFIAWRYRWVWAAEIAGWLSMLGVRCPGGRHVVSGYRDPPHRSG